MMGCLDSMDPEDYVIGVLHIPPGYNAEELLDTSVRPVLQRFFKKLAKHPTRPMRKQILNSPDSKLLDIVSEGASSRMRLPFLGRYSQGGYCLRQLYAYRLQISLSDSNYCYRGADDGETDLDEDEEKSKLARNLGRKRKLTDVNPHLKEVSRKRTKFERNSLR